jgi:hypothetical protein
LAPHFANKRIIVRPSSPVPPVTTTVLFDKSIFIVSPTLKVINTLKTYKLKNILSALFLQQCIEIPFKIIVSFFKKI